MVKSLPAVWETQVQSLGREDPLEKKMATHSSILAWKERLEPGRLQSMGSQRVGHDSLCKSEGGGGRVFTAEIPGWFGDGKKLVDSCLTF